MIDLWNASHDDKITLTVIPDDQMVTKLATGVQSGDVPDLVSFDLIYMPDFMRAGFLVDLTDQLKADPNQAKVAKAYADLATFDGKMYGTGFTPDVSVLLWNKDLFKKAGLGPDKAPTSIPEIHADAAKIRALGGDIYGFYFSGACPGCNIFVTSPAMVASGAKLLPHDANEEPLQGDGVKQVLTEYRAMWTEGLIPASAQADGGQNFFSVFQSGKIGIIGSARRGAALPRVAASTESPSARTSVRPRRATLASGTRTSRTSRISRCSTRRTGRAPTGSRTGSSASYSSST
jgi:multiple sugar transport system substrate-binding protein